MSDNERFEAKLITNWNEAPDGSVMELDYTEDAWEYGAPPPRGVYTFKMLPGKDTIKMNRVDAADPKTTYFTINYEARVVSENPEYNDVAVFGMVDTRVRRGKSISTAAGLLVKAGVNVASMLKGQPATDKKIAQICEALLKKEAQVKGELDWRGAYSYRENGKTDDTWVNVYNHYEEFPIDPKDGTRKHLVSVNSKGGGVTEVRAQARITRFFGKGDTLPVFNHAATSQGLVSGPRTMSQPISAPVAPVVTPTTVAAPQFASPTPQTVDSGEVDLMLE